MSKRRSKNDIYELISINIRKYRKEKGYTQLQLAKITKYTPEYIRRIESKKSKKYFSIDTISNIAEALDIELYLFFKDNEN